MKPYTVGLTIYVKPDGDLGLFENGLKQNVIFLYKLFKASPNCKRVFLLNDTGVTPVIPDRLKLKQEDFAPTAGVIDQLDYTIVVGASLEKPLVEALHDRGAKVISYRGGNDAVFCMEAIAARPEPSPAAPCFYDHGSFDAIWITPQHTRTNKAWSELVYRCPVHEVPQVWDPSILEAVKTPGFGYRPGKRPWRIAIFEPNNTVMKTSYWPMLVCEVAWRQDKKAFKHFFVTNTVQFKENQSFNSFAGALDIVKDNVASFEPRFPTSQFLTQHADAVVTHQWENALNYLYYDVLYGGYPLIHNSPMLKGYGYYYEDFHPYDGAHALLKAVANHDAALLGYQAENRKLFKRLSPTSKALIETHERLLAATEDPALAS